MPVTDPNADTILDKLNPEVRELVQRLRLLIAERIPEAAEKAHPGWGVFHYRTRGTMRDVIVAISPQRSYANLEFGDGVDLPDPAHKLEGTGKRLRHVKIRSTEDIQNPDLHALIEAAKRQRRL